MKHLNNMLSEVKGEKAHKEAVAMGLKYKGFGYWADPTTGQTKYKTENDALVPVEAEVVADTYTGGNPAGIPGQDDQQGGPMGQGMGGQQGMGGPGGAPQVAPGANIASAEPGKELAPLEADASSWEPGPDGDTCVGPDAEEEPGQIPRDSYVGKTNYYAWTAGPDGSNITNVDLANMDEKFSLSPNVELFEEEGPDKMGAVNIAQQLRGPSVAGEPSVAKRIRNLPTGDKTQAIHGMMNQGAGVPYPQVYDPKFNSNIADAGAGKQRSGYKTFMDRMYGERSAGNSMVAKAQDAYEKVRGVQGALEKRDGRNAIKPGSQMMNRFRMMAQDEDHGNLTNLYFGKAFAQQMPGIADSLGDRLKNQNELDNNTTDYLNNHYQKNDYLKDPDLDLDQDLDDDNHIGDGAYGDVFSIEDSQGNPAVLKTGKIGPAEFDVMKQMSDDPGFPDLLNAKLSTPYANLAALENNPLDLQGAENMIDEYHPMGAQAFGRFAMERVPGETVGDHGAFVPGGGRLDQDDELVEKMQREFWDLRGRMHKAGIAHNDQHAENIFYDEDSEEMHFIDFGLAQQHPIAALMEGLGGSHEGDFSHPSLGDTQMNSLDRWKGQGGSDESGEAIDYEYGAMFGPNGGMLPEDLKQTLSENRNNIRKKLDEDLGPEAADFLDTMMQGGIGMGKDTLDSISHGLGAMAMNEETGQHQMTEDGHNNIMSIIDMLYDGVSFAPGERKARETASKRSSEKESSNFKDIKKSISPINAFSAPPESGFGRMKPLLDRDD